jgi:hypothetical protein
MRSRKKKSMEQLTSTLMALMMAVTTTMSPVITLASELESSMAAVESQIEETTAEESTAEPSTVVVQSETAVQDQTDTETTALQAVSSDEASEVETKTDASTEAETVSTEEATYNEEETTTLPESDPSGEESTEESKANETRGPDESETAQTPETSGTSAEETSNAETSEASDTTSEVPTIELSYETTKEEILSYIEAIGGNESDAFYEFIGGLDTDMYQLVWMAQYGAEEDQLKDTFDFDYDAASDLDACRYLQKLSEEDLIAFVEAMTYEQYCRYLSIKEMMAEMDEKDFSDVIDEEEFTADRTWDYESYDAFAESLTGVDLQRTEQTMQFYNTYVDPSKVQAGVTTIDSLLNSNADWYSNDYILGLNPEMFKETVPVYHGSDGNYYVVSTVPTLNGVESADYQPATSFYNGGVEAQAFTDIEYLGNGVYRIPSSRYKYCFTEQYVSDMGTLYGISFGLRIQVLYGFTPSGEITIAADVVYPDMTERFLPATLNLLAGTATVRIFNDTYDDSVDNYLVSASINRGASLPDSVGSMNDGKVLQFVVNDANAVGSLDVLIGYNATSKYSMAAEVTTSELIGAASDDVNVNMAAEMYNGAYLKLDQASVPKNLAVGDKFIYANTALTITGVETSYDLSNTAQHPDRGIHVGAKTIPTHDAQSFCFYNGKGADTDISSWFRTQLNTDAADPGYMVQMTEENMKSRAAWNGTSTNLRQSQFPTINTPKNHIFGYMTDGLGAVSGTDGKVLNLEGTSVLLSCMHAWGNESATTPQDIVDSISTFTGRTQKDFAIDEGFGHYHPNIALQCTDVHDGGDGFTYATFKVLTSMLQVGGVKYAQNYQCAFSTIRLIYETNKKGKITVQKASSNTTLTNGNKCYNFTGIKYGIYSDANCTSIVATVTLNANGTSDPVDVDAGTYYVKEISAPSGSGYKVSSDKTTVTIAAGESKTANVKDEPMNDPFGIQITKISASGATADLSGAEYTITYYPKHYNSVAEINAETDTSIKPTKWVIQTKKTSNGLYLATLDDNHIVSGSAVFGKTGTMYTIPLGTITVQETKAPVGFTVDGATVTNVKTKQTVAGTDGVFLFKLVNENSGVALKSGNSLSTTLDGETAMTLQYSEKSINLKTTLTEDSSKSHYAKADSTISLTDRLEYENLSVGKHYVVRATLYIKDGNNLTEHASKTVDLYPTATSGTLDVLFSNISTNGLSGKTLVCYETLTVNGSTVAEHKNPNDVGQTVNFPSVHTTATEKSTGNHIAKATKSLTIVDTVSMSALRVGDTYKIKGILMDKATGQPLKVNGANVELERSFTATSTSTTQTLEFTIDAASLNGATTVVYESLYYGTLEISSHKDINDEGQTVYLPKIRTTAKDNASGTQKAAPVKNTTIVDTVTYTNLIPGKSYTVTGKLMNKATGKVVTVGGAEVSASKTFTASNTGSGSVDVSFAFDATGLTGTFVVFENVYYNNIAVATHEELSDEGQTIRFSKVTILKKSQDDDMVVGAKLEIRDKNGKAVETFETDENGKVFYRLDFDTNYTLVETEAPEGYFVADPITFQLKENGKVLVDGKELDELTMIDEYSTGYLEVTKQSIVSHKLLPGAVYGVYSDEACTNQVAELTTDENGQATVLLEHGDYWVKELKAPTNYRFDYTVYGPFTIEGKHITVPVTLYDEPLTPVPTGVTLPYLPYVAALGLGVVVLVVIRRGKKKA